MTCLTVLMAGGVMVDVIAYYLYIFYGNWLVSFTVLFVGVTMSVVGLIMAIINKKK